MYRLHLNFLVPFKLNRWTTEYFRSQTVFILQFLPTGSFPAGNYFCFKHNLLVFKLWSDFSRHKWLKLTTWASFLISGWPLGQRPEKWRTFFYLGWCILVSKVSTLQLCQQWSPPPPLFISVISVYESKSAYGVETLFLTTAITNAGSRYRYQTQPQPSPPPSQHVQEYLPVTIPTSPLPFSLYPIPSGESIWGSRSKKDRLLKNQWR